mgnify:CR=1 FL=1
MLSPVSAVSNRRTYDGVNCFLLLHRKGAAKNGKELDSFFRDDVGNGELQIWDAEAGALISRCDAFVLVNCFLDIDAANDAWDAVIAEREQAARK